MATFLLPVVPLSEIEQVKLTSSTERNSHTFELTYRDGRKSVSIKLSAPSLDVAEMWVTGLQRLTKGYKQDQGDDYIGCLQYAGKMDLTDTHKMSFRL